MQRDASEWRTTWKRVWEINGNRVGEMFFRIASKVTVISSLYIYDIGLSWFLYMGCPHIVLVRAPTP